MGSTYKILGQAQGSTASALQNINLFPDPNMERYTGDTTATNPGTISIWQNTGAHDGHTTTSYIASGGQGSDVAGKTNYVQFNQHEQRDPYWSLKPAVRPYLDPAKTYTLSFWYQTECENTSYWHGGRTSHYIGWSGQNADGGNIVQSGDGWTQHHQSSSRGGFGSQGAWQQYYTTFAGTGNYFNISARNYVGHSNTWLRIKLDNIYLTDSAIPQALIPSKAPDGASGNANALYTAPFTTRSEGWQGVNNESATVRKLTGSWQNLYMVPDVEGTSAVLSTISITNIGSVASTYRVAIQKAGEILTHKHILAFDTPIVANGIDTLTLGVTLGKGDKVIVQSDTDKIQFAAYGSENTL